ncbi:MAG: RluA family pseudouridine synthase [Clostridia bacterium]|nr:RluA family pseudouridine synthase [Clostridia bacterium]
MEILYEDASVIVCIKPATLVSEQTPDGSGFADLLAARNGGYIGTVHRLDRGVGGVMVYAKTQDAAAKLSRQVQERTLEKEYLAIVHGTPEEHSAELRDLLFHDRRLNKSFVVDRVRNGVKEAILDYVVQKTLETDAHGTLSLVRVRLHTGRTHQIRVQFSSRRHPLLGDGKYGASDRCPIALFGARIAFLHPKTGKKCSFEVSPTDAVWLPFLEM